MTIPTIVATIELLCEDGLIDLINEPLDDDILWRYADKCLACDVVLWEATFDTRTNEYNTIISMQWIDGCNISSKLKDHLLEVHKDEMTLAAMRVCAKRT